MMRIWFGLILKITVSERISKITARTKSYVSLKNAISQNDLIHERNYHSFQGSTPIIYMRKSTPRFASISFPNFRRNESGSSSVFRKSASACLGQGEIVENVSAERDKNHLNCTKS